MTSGGFYATVHYSESYRTAARQAPWWTALAANPPCEPWCEETHHIDAFAVDQGLVCVRPFHRAVAVTLEQSADVDVPFKTDRGDPVVEVLTGELDCAPSTAAARELAAALLDAAAFVEKVSAQ